MLNDSQAIRQGRRFDIAIIGAGPAGLAAIETLRNFDLNVAVIDEQPRAGGQFLRQPPATFRVDNWLTKALYRRAKSTLRAVEQHPDVVWMPGTTVLGLQPTAGSSSRSAGYTDIWLQHETGHEVITARNVLLASGCYERPLAIPGWTLPGVMGTGGIQAFIKSQQFVPGNRFVLAGSHPLQLVVADQLATAGAKVEAVVFTQKLQQALAMFRYPLAMLYGVPQLMETARIIGRLRKASVRILFGRSIAAVDGTDAVERVSVAKIDSRGRLNRSQTDGIHCDRLGMCHGFLASSEIARQAGADVQYRPDAGGWLVCHDRWFQTSVTGLFAAGEVTALAGADASIFKGRIAAVGLLRLLRLVSESDAEKMAMPSRRKLQQCERFAAMLNALSKPPDNLATSSVTDETVICRCELITHRELLDKLEEHTHIASADAAKLYTRTGMGACQGRFCGEHVMRMVAGARQLQIGDIGMFETRFPVKPLNLGLLKVPGDHPGG